MLKCLFVIFTLLVPVKLSTIGGLKQYSYPNQVVAMAPPPDGNFLSDQAGRAITNKVNPPGCTVETTRRNRRDGTTEVRETLRCTTVRIEDSSGQTQQTRPSSSSKLNKKDGRTVNDFMSGRK